MLEKFVTINNSEFDVIRKLTENGWKVTKTIRVSDSKSQYVLTKPDVNLKIKG